MTPTNIIIWYFITLSPHDEEKNMLNSDVLYMRETHALSVEI